MATKATGRQKASVPIPPKVNDKLIYQPPPTIVGSGQTDGTLRYDPSPNLRTANMLISGNAPPTLQGSAEFNAAIAKLKESQNFLRPSNLTGKKHVEPGYVVGGQARIAALGEVKQSLKGVPTTGPSSGISMARDKLALYIKGQTWKANDQRSAAQSALAPLRASQRAAIQANQAVSSGRKPRRSAAAVIPNMMSLLSPGSRRI